MQGESARIVMTGAFIQTFCLSWREWRMGWRVCSRAQAEHESFQYTKFLHRPCHLSLSFQGHFAPCGLVQFAVLSARIKWPDAGREEWVENPRCVLPEGITRQGLHSHACASTFQTRLGDMEVYGQLSGSRLFFKPGIPSIFGISSGKPLYRHCYP